MIRLPAVVRHLRLLVTLPAILSFVASRPAATQPRVPRLDRAECPFQRPDWLTVATECHWLVVPETRGQATGRTIRLAVAVLKATAPTQAPLVMLHGGPGASGIRTYLPVVRTDLARDRDVVLYDQRGAGYSQPTLCPEFGGVRDSARHLRSLNEQQAFWDAEERKCVALLRAEGVDRSAYNTVASAADLADLRKALGYETWNVYGGSYGARLAQEGMRRDAAGIRSVILESPVTRDPTMQLEIGLSAQRVFDRVWRDCGAQPSCAAAFPTVASDFLEMYDTLTKRPIPIVWERAGTAADTVWLDGPRLMNIIRESVLGRPGRLSRLPQLVHELRHGDRIATAHAFAAFDSASSGGSGQQQVIVHLVNCYDVFAPTFRKAQDSLNTLLPSAFRKVELAECPLWQDRFAETSERAPVRSDLPVLLATGRFDDRTTTDHARRIATTLTHAYMYEFPNEGHGARPVGCHLSILVAFLADPSRAPDASCIASIPPIRFVTPTDTARRPPRAFIHR